MSHEKTASWRTARKIGLGVGVASVLALPFAGGARIAHSAAPITDAWRSVPIAPRRSTLLGLSFRPPQIEALGLAVRPTLQALLAYPFQIVRLGAYWNRIERSSESFDPEELDWQVEAAERAGKQVILCVGAVKTFSYPEYYVPAHRLAHPLPEQVRITPTGYPSLLASATEFIERIVDRYKPHDNIIAWQVEHEAVDPLGLEHSWRLDASFVEHEVNAVRKADPSRPILLNGFLPTSWPAMIAQWWQTRDQGDSLAVAQRLADIVGIDYYPRYALARFGSLTMYLDGAKGIWPRKRHLKLMTETRVRKQKLMITEGQAEPWETVTVPPSPDNLGMASCLPERIIHNYNACLGWSHQDAPLYAYLFWGAEYWMLRAKAGDPSYLSAFARVLEQS